MTIRQAIPVMRGANCYVPSLFYAVDVGLDAFCRADLGAPVALDADGILDGQDIAAASNTKTFAAAYNALLNSGLAKYGRNVTVVASGAATSTVTVYGLDYLMQPMSEVLTLNGAVPVLGVKCFKWITQVAWGATAATTIDVGWGNALGIPYRATRTTLSGELVSGAAPTAGALVAGASGTAAQTSTSADPRGTYTPHSASLPDGTRTYEFVYHTDVVNGLHGKPHFYS